MGEREGRERMEERKGERIKGGGEIKNLLFPVSFLFNLNCKLFNFTLTAVIDEIIIVFGLSGKLWT